MESKKKCSTPDHKFTRIRERTPLELSRIQESPDSFDADIESRGASFVSTPISTRCGGTNSQRRVVEHHVLKTACSEKNKKTPLRKTKLNANESSETSCAPSMLVNPFEHYLLDKLHTHTCSPSIFAKVVSPSDDTSSDGNFWSIDHIALINPVDIDVSSVHHHSSMKVDDETESRIQATVDRYFAESVIAPSPWCESMTSIRRPKPRETSSLPNSPSSGVYTQSCNLNVTVATQTMLTFKPEIDLVALLAKAGMSIMKWHHFGRAFQELQYSPYNQLSISNIRQGEKFLFTEENPQPKEIPSTSATSDSTPSIVGNSMRRKLFVSANKDKPRPKGRSPRRALQL